MSNREAEFHIPRSSTLPKGKQLSQAEFKSCSAQVSNETIIDLRTCAIICCLLRHNLVGDWDQSKWVSTQTRNSKRYGRFPSGYLIA